MCAFLSVGITAWEGCLNRQPSHAVYEEKEVPNGKADWKHRAQKITNGKIPRVRTASEQNEERPELGLIAPGKAPEDGGDLYAGENDRPCGGGSLKSGDPAGCCHEDGIDKRCGQKGGVQPISESQPDLAMRLLKEPVVPKAFFDFRR